MPSNKYTPPTVSTVTLSSSVLLSLLRHTSEHYPSIFSGALLGFEDEKTVDITHAFPFPYPDQYEGGSFKSKSGSQYQKDLLENYKKLGYGVEFQGWFQSTVSGSFVTSQLEKNKISYLNLFDELELDVQNQALVDLYLASSKPASITESDYNVVNLLSNSNSTAHLLESLYGQVDSFNYDQNNFNYYQRQYSKEQGKIQQWKQQRKYENLERAKNGEKELDTDEWKSQFKLPVEPSRLNNMLYSHSIDVLADDILKKCDEKLQKSFAINRKLTS